MLWLGMYRKLEKCEVNIPLKDRISLDAAMTKLLSVLDIPKTDDWDLAGKQFNSDDMSINETVLHRNSFKVEVITNPNETEDDSKVRYKRMVKTAISREGKLRALL